MGRTDPAGGEQIVVAGAQRVHRFDDRGGIVGHHAHFVQTDVLDLQPAGDLRDVLVVRPAREDLVPDHDKGGGEDAGIGHGAGLERCGPFDKVGS